MGQLRLRLLSRLRGRITSAYTTVTSQSQRATDSSPETCATLQEVLLSAPSTATALDGRTTTSSATADSLPSSSPVSFSLKIPCLIPSTESCNSPLTTSRPSWIALLTYPMV